MTFLPGSPGTMVVAGSALLQGMPTWFLASRMRSMDGSTGMLFGVVPDGWSFKQAFPDADIPLVSELELSNVGLLFSSDEFIASSDDLYGEVYGFYRALYGRDDFMVNIRPGVNLVASLPVDGMDPDSPLIPLMDKLGVQRGPALLQGALGSSVKDIYFRASLPRSVRRALRSGSSTASWTSSSPVSPRSPSSVRSPSAWTRTSWSSS